MPAGGIGKGTIPPHGRRPVPSPQRAKIASYTPTSNSRSLGTPCRRGPRIRGVPRLLLSELSFPDVRKKSGMGRATLGKMCAGFGQAESAVHRQPDIRGVFVLLAVVFPPANRAQAKRFGRIQRLKSTARAAITSPHGNPHVRWTPNVPCGFTQETKFVTGPFEGYSPSVRT